jgi:hypothetical protein
MNHYLVRYRPTYMHPSQTPDEFTCEAQTEEDAEHDCLNHYPESQICSVEEIEPPPLLTANELYKTLDKLGWDWSISESFEGLRVVNIVVKEETGLSKDNMRFFQAFTELYTNQCPLTIEQFVRFKDGDTDAVPSETLTALYDALEIWNAAIEGSKRDD